MARILGSAALHCAAALTAWLACAGAGPGAPAYDYQRRVGMAGPGDSGRCVMVIGDSLLKPGDPVTLVCVPDAGESSATSTIRVARVGERTHAPGAAGWAPGPGEYVYSLRDSCEVDQDPELCFALTAPPRTLSIVGGHAQADFDSDETTEWFQVCSSYEGVHLSIWSGRPYRGTLRWSRYFYVPYATDPTCGDTDSLEPGQERDR